MIKRSIQKLLKPYIVAISIFTIDYKKLKAENTVNLAFDIDNTIVKRSELLPDWKTKKLFQELKRQGFFLLLVSNNTHKKRISLVADFLEISVVFSAYKPLPWVYLHLQKDFKIKTANSIFIGDQLFTDILGAKLAGFKAIYTRPLEPEKNIFRRLMLLVEKMIVNWL